MRPALQHRQQQQQQPLQLRGRGRPTSHSVSLVTNSLAVPSVRLAARRQQLWDSWQRSGSRPHAAAQLPVARLPLCSGARSRRPSTAVKCISAAAASLGG